MINNIMNDVGVLEPLVSLVGEAAGSLPSRVLNRIQYPTPQDDPGRKFRAAWLFPQGLGWSPAVRQSCERELRVCDQTCGHTLSYG